MQIVKKLFSIYPFYLKTQDFRYRFLRWRSFKKLAIGLAITRLLKDLHRKNQVAKKPVSSGRMGILLLSSINQSFATPPFEVLRTCIDIKPFENMSKISRIRGDGYAEKSLEGCADQYDRTIDGHLYGTLFCKDKFYMIIKDKKMDPEKAENHSMNPEVNPGVAFTTRSLWYKINFNKQDYLCIYAPLAEQGVGASHNQYYIIENAFDAKIDPKIYYYFMDKNITPITSSTL